MAEHTGRTVSKGKMIIRPGSVVSAGEIMMLNFSSAEKKPVMTTDGKNVGSMVGCTVDNANWSVVNLTVELTKEVSDFLGAKGGMLKSPIVGVKPSMVGTVGDAVMLNVSLADLKGRVEEIAAQKKGLLSGI